MVKGLAEFPPPPARRRSREKIWEAHGNKTNRCHNPMALQTVRARVPGEEREFYNVIGAKRAMLERAERPIG